MSFAELSFLHSRRPRYAILLGAILVFVVSGRSVPSGVAYRNLAAVELARGVMGAKRPAYIPIIAPLHDSHLALAADYLSRSVALDPTVAATYRLTAMSAAAQGDWDLTTKNAEHAIRLDPSDKMANLLLGFSYWRMGRVAESILAWKRAEAAIGLSDMASHAQRVGNAPEAIDLYTLARKVDPLVAPRIESRVDLAWAFYFSGRKNEAFAELKAGLEDPRQQEGWQRLIANGETGMYYLREGQWQDAIDSYQAALALVPGVAQYRLWMGRAYMELGQLDLAERELLRTTNDAAVGDIHATAHFFLGRLYALRGQGDQSVDAYAKAAELSPDNLEFRLYLARAYSNAGLKELALEEWKAVVTMHPEDPQLRAWYEEAKSQ